LSNPTSCLRAGGPTSGSVFMRSLLGWGDQTEVKKRTCKGHLGHLPSHFLSFLSPNDPQVAEWESLKAVAVVVVDVTLTISEILLASQWFYQQQCSHTITNGTERSDENDMHHNSDVLQEDYDSLEVTISFFSIGGPSEYVFVPPEATTEKDLFGHHLA
jgi:hypothetical protein